jgi:hypothetical protein
MDFLFHEIIMCQFERLCSLFQINKSLVKVEISIL